jgi:hypothetical protein
MSKLNFLCRQSFVNVEELFTLAPPPNVYKRILHGCRHSFD